MDSVNIRLVYMDLSVNECAIEFIGTLTLCFVIFTTFNPMVIGAIYIILLIFSSRARHTFFNPATTVALASMGSLRVDDAGIIIILQVCAGILASQIALRVTGSVAN